MAATRFTAVLTARSVHNSEAAKIRATAGRYWFRDVDTYRRHEWHLRKRDEYNRIAHQMILAGHGN